MNNTDISLIKMRIRARFFYSRFIALLFFHFLEIFSTLVIKSTNKYFILYIISLGTLKERQTLHNRTSGVKYWISVEIVPVLMMQGIWPNPI